MTSRLFKIYVVFCFFVGFIVSVFPNSLFNILADVFFVVLLFTCLTSNLNRNIVIPTVLIVSLLLIVLSCVWSFGNENDLSTILLNARQYKNFLLFVPLAYVAAYDFQFFMKVYKYSLWLSVPLSVLQYLTVDKSLPAYADHVVGVFGYGQSGTLSILIIIYVTFEILRRERIGQKLVDWYLVLLFPILLNETKIVFAMLPVVFVYSYVVLSDKASNFFKILPIFLVGFVVAESSYRFAYNVSIFNFFNSEFIEEYFFVDQIHSSQEIDVGRFKRVEYALGYLDRLDASNYYFGLGLGSSFVGSDSGQIGQAAKEFYEIGLHTGSRIQLYYMVLDFGIAGSFIFILIIIVICFHAAFTRTKSESKLIAVPSSVVFLLSLFYQTPFSSHVISLVFFFSYFTLLYDSYNNTDLLKSKLPVIGKRIRFVF